MSRSTRKLWKAWWSLIRAELGEHRDAYHQCQMEDTMRLCLGASKWYENARWCLACRNIGDPLDTPLYGRLMRKWTREGKEIDWTRLRDLSIGDERTQQHEQ